MKHVIVFLLLCPIFTLAQSETSKEAIDNRLYEVFDEDYLIQLQKQNSFLIQRWTYYLDHAFYIVEDPKLAEYDYPSVKIADLTHFNILKIEREQALERDLNKESTYHIEGTNKALIYHSARVFNKNLNHHLKRSNNKG